MKKKTVSFLVSGRGSNFSAVAEKIRSGEIRAEIGCVISNKAEAAALDIARSMNIPAYAVPSKSYLTRKGHEKEMVKLLKKHHTDLIVTAGYMRILTPYIIREYRMRMINIHPALLPSFKGISAQKQAFEYGVKITGCTAHFVDEGTDTGPIIVQRSIDIAPDDTASAIAKKLLPEEYIALSEAVRLFCENRLDVIGRKVHVLSSK